MKISPAVLCLALLVSSGCHSSNQAAHRASPAGQSAVVHRGRADLNAVPGDFDYYVLNLSWSPEFCETHPANPECAARPGFVVHGLWPQNNDGTYPENCSNPTVPTYPASYLNLMPTVDLIEHEWKAHGTCSGLGPDAYFDQVRTALRSVEIPPTFAASQMPPTKIAPDILLAQFAGANPSFPRSSFALSCGNNQLTAVEVCFDKNLNPTACQGIRSCRARSIKISSR